MGTSRINFDPIRYGSTTQSKYRNEVVPIETVKARYHKVHVACGIKSSANEWRVGRHGLCYLPLLSYKKIMNQSLLARRAQKLNLLLTKYALINPDAVKLRRALDPLIQEAIKGELMNPLNWQDIPGDLLFSEESLGEYTDFSDAFSKFKIEASGGPLPGLQNVRRRAGLDPITGDPVSPTGGLIH